MTRIISINAEELPNILAKSEKATVSCLYWKLKDFFGR